MKKNIPRIPVVAARDPAPTTRVIVVDRNQIVFDHACHGLVVTTRNDKANGRPEFLATHTTMDEDRMEMMLTMTHVRLKAMSLGFRVAAIWDRIEELWDSTRDAGPDDDDSDIDEDIDEEDDDDSDIDPDGVEPDIDLSGDPEYVLWRWASNNEADFERLRGQRIAVHPIHGLVASGPTLREIMQQLDARGLLDDAHVVAWHVPSD